MISGKMKRTKNWKGKWCFQGHIREPGKGVEKGAWREMSVTPISGCVSPRRVQGPELEVLEGLRAWGLMELAEGLFRRNNIISFISLSVQFSSVTQLCPALCDPMDCSTPGLPVHRQLPELTQTHVHRVGDAIQPSHPLSSPSPPAFNLSQHHGLF